MSKDTVYSLSCCSFNYRFSPPDVLRRHYETAKRKKNLLPYLAIIHVRDMLITPSER